MAELTADASLPVRCGDCDLDMTAEEVAEIGDCALTAGDPSPVGRCPQCDMLVYVEDNSPKTINEELLSHLEYALASLLYLEPERWDDEEHQKNWNQDIADIRAVIARAKKAS